MVLFACSFIPCAIRCGIYFLNYAYSFYPSQAGNLLHTQAAIHPLQQLPHPSAPVFHPLNNEPPAHRLQTNADNSYSPSPAVPSLTTDSAQTSFSSSHRQIARCAKNEVHASSEVPLAYSKPFRFCFPCAQAETSGSDSHQTPPTIPFPLPADRFLSAHRIQPAHPPSPFFETVPENVPHHRHGAGKCGHSFV